MQKISIIVPTWKRAEKLHVCLNKLSIQETKPFEILVILRREDLEGIEVAKSFAENLKELKIVFTEKPGVVNAENVGLATAVGDIVAFIDDDGYAEKDWLTKISSFYAANPYAGGYGGSDIIKTEPWTYYDYSVDIVGKVTWYGKVIGNHHRKAKGVLREVDVLKGVNMSFKKSCLTFLDTRLAGIDGHLGNGSQWELDLCLTIKKNGYKLFFDPSLVVIHDSDHSLHVKEIVAINNAHNLSYVIAKHFMGFRYLVFLIYALVVGNEQLPGFIKMIIDVIRFKNIEPVKRYKGKLYGFFQGIYTYWYRGRN